MKQRSTWRIPSLVCLLSVVVACFAPSVSTRAEAPKLAFIELLSGGANTKETLPLLIAMHGLGDSPEGFAPLFASLPIKARIIAPRAPDPWGEGSSWYPIDDEVAKPRVIRQRAQLVIDLIKQVMQTRPTKGLPVVTGFSQGGVLSFALAAEHASLLRAAFPIAGTLPVQITPAKAPSAGFEVTAFHGTVDRRITFADGERSVRTLKSKGYAATLQAFEGVGHGVSPAMQSALFTALSRALTNTPAAQGAPATNTQVAK